MENELKAPAGLQATADPGINRVELSTADLQDASYEIWRRHGDTVDWYLHATFSSPVFEDKNVMPGQYYEYKVRSVRGDVQSEFSPSAVVYGK